MSMVIDRVDDSDHVIGTISRAEVFRAHANFRVVHVFLFHSDRQLILQQLAPTRERNPGRWGSSVAAYLFSGESYAAAAHRRLREELSIDNLDLDVVGKTVMNDEGCHKYITLIRAVHDGPLRPDPTHIADLQFAELRSVARMVSEHPDAFTPTFLHVFDFFRSQSTH
jgi:isopentenyl-diphosphate delta-isomerase